MATEILVLPRDPARRHLKRVQELAESEGVSQELKDEINRVIELVVARDEYCDNITSASSESADNLMKETFSHPWGEAYKAGQTTLNINPHMMSGHLESQFLKSIVSMSRAKRVLELGLFTGCGALAMAEVLPEDGVVYSCELEPYIASVARGLMDKSPHGKKVEILTGPAAEGIAKLGEKKEKVDIVFMDADKQGYMNYYNLIFEHDLLAPGGTIVVDNALWGGYPYSHENPMNMQNGPAIEKFNDFVRQKNDIHRVMVPMRDGVMLIRRREDVDKS